MLLTEHQARALAFLLNQMRPDWPVQSLLTLFGKHREVPSLGAVMIAATTKALDPSCKTPAPIFTTGPHWPAEHRDQLPRGPRCTTHPTFNQPCPCCRADSIAEKKPDPYEQETP